MNDQAKGRAIFKIFKVQGMDCPDCAAKIEKAAARIKGVKSATTSFATSKLTIEMEGLVLDTEGIKRVIEGLGHKVEEETKTTRSISLFVEGMDCTDEAELIEKKLNGLKGIKDYRIDLLGQKIKLDYDPALTSVQEIIRTIAETGMKARTEKERERLKPWWQELKMVFLFSCGMISLLAYSLQLLGFSEIAVKALYGLAIAIGGYYPARIGLAAVRTLALNINTLLVVAALGAVALDLWEEAAVLVFVYSLGAVLETYAVDRARGSIRALMELAPKKALVRKDGEEIVLPVEEVAVGDIIIVRPGERISLDGWVSGGSSTVDQSPITGESIPTSKGAGDEVYAGTINQRGSLEVVVSKLSKDSTVVRIIQQVEEAQARKSSYQRFSEKFGKYYTPAIFLLASLVSVVPPIFFGQAFSPWFYRGLVLLVVSCSCGLALSVPVAVVAAIANAARHGVLIKGGAYLEAASGLKVLAFDKTGTLTIGRPRVTDIIPDNGVSEREVLAIAAAVESRSEHPLADAILRRAREEGVEIPRVEDFEALPGVGARGKVDGRIYHLGSSRLFQGKQLLSEELLWLQSQGKTVIFLAGEEKPLGIIAVADQLRQGVGEVIKELKEVGVGKIVMLTGDNEGTARAVAAEAGVDEYRAQLLPEEKVRVIEELRGQYGKVAMVGDGVNDAPAMATADVGIAMGAAGTDVALETGDLALMSDDLSKLPSTLKLSRKSVKNIQQNIAASLAIVAFLVPAALGGWIGLVPGLLLNEISALMVIGNGLRLLRFGDGGQ